MVLKRVGLHPLVMLNLSDHYARSKQGALSSELIGVLLGNEDNGVLQLLNSFEFVMEDGMPDLSALQTRLEQQSVILPNEYIVGVYQITHKSELKPEEQMVQLHEILNGYSNELVTLLFNPELAGKKFTNQKFVKVFDSKANELSIEVDTKESEKVAVDTVLDVKENDCEDQLKNANEQLESQSFILQTIRSKVQLIIAYLEKTDPSTPGYYEILRNANSFISKIQYKQSEEIKTKLVDIETDYNTMISMGSLTENIKALESISLNLKKYGDQ